MIKQALEYLMGLNPVEKLAYEGREYTNKQLYPVSVPGRPKSEFSTLTGFGDFCLMHKDLIKFITVIDFGRVEAWTEMDSKWNVRSLLATTAIDHWRETFSIGRWVELENFLIGLQSAFVPNLEITKVLKALGTMDSENTATTQDDGVTQQIKTRIGVSLKEFSEIENPVRLRPYRTFSEVDQPESNFILRVRKGHNENECALFEAEGSQWKLKAMESIKKFLEKHVKDGIPVFA